MPQPPKVAVVLLHHQDYAARYLSSCYDSLMKQRYPRDRFDIVVVTNGDTEGGSELVRRLAPEAKELKNATNLGWSGGNNRAIRRLLLEDAEHIVLLNIDTVVEPEWLSALTEAATQRGEVHILQSKILLRGTGQLQSAGNRIHFLGYGYCNGYGQPAETSASRFPMDFASGAAMLVKREVFERIGLFREEYFLYYEDLEFCWRARLAGFNVGIAEASVCHHHYDFKHRWQWLYYFQRNRLLTLLTLERRATLLVTLPCLMVSELALAVYFAARGSGRTSLRLASYFLRPSTWAYIARCRRQVKPLRVRKDAGIVRGFAGRIAFTEMPGPLFNCVVNPLLSAYWALARRLIVW